MPAGVQWRDLHLHRGCSSLLRQEASKHRGVSYNAIKMGRATWELLRQLTSPLHPGKHKEDRAGSKRLGQAPVHRQGEEPAGPYCSAA